MKDGTIVTLVFTNGMEVVGKYIIDDMVNYTIYKPRLVQVTQQGVRTCQWYLYDRQRTKK